MPTPRPDESRSDFVSRCIPDVLAEGTAEDQKQAVAICFSMWREDKDEAKALVMKITKVRKLQNGRIRWQARANTGEFDLVQERFDQSFFDDVVANHYRVKEAQSKGIELPNGMTAPILDVSHYSIYGVPLDVARVGWPDKLWRDGRAMFAQGFYDDTRKGQIAAQAALEREPEDRRVSIVVFPDYSLVELEVGGRKVYRGEGGTGKAWMHSLAMTSTPCDPGAILEVKSMTTAKEDALQVLGEDASDIVEEWEKARKKTKTLPDGALIKAKGETEMSEGENLEEQEEEQEQAEMTEPEATTEEPEQEPTEDVADTVEDALTMSALTGALDKILPGIATAIDQRFEPLTNAVEALAVKSDKLDAQIKALATEESAKVKAALDSDGDWFDRMWGNSVQRSESAVKGEGKEKGPAEAPASEYAARYGNRGQ